MAQVRVDSFILLSKCQFYAMNRREIVMKAIFIPKFCFSIPSGKRSMGKSTISMAMASIANCFTRKSPFFMEKSTINTIYKWAIFNSYVYVYQAGYPYVCRWNHWRWSSLEFQVLGCQSPWLSSRFRQEAWQIFPFLLMKNSLWY